MLTILAVYVVVSLFLGFSWPIALVKLVGAAILPIMAMLALVLMGAAVLMFTAAII